MTSSSAAIFPYCAQCHTVEVQGDWIHSMGVSEQTDRKLSICARCHIARYCDGDCQRMHWSTHKVGCVGSERIISPQNVDKCVKSACQAQPGKVYLYLDAQKNVLETQTYHEPNEDKLDVTLNIAGKNIGTYSYRICYPDTELPGNLKKRILEVKSVKDSSIRELQLLELAYEILELRLYHKAFDLISKNVVGEKSRFFKNALPILLRQVVPHKTIDALRKSIDIDDDILYHMAVAHAMLGDTTYAIQMAKQSPDPDKCYGLICLAFLERNKPQEAKEFLALMSPEKQYHVPF